MGIVSDGLTVFGGLALMREGANLAVERTKNNLSYQLGKPSVGITQISIGNVDITLPVTILNSNEFPITFDRFEGMISYGTVPLGTIIIPSEIYIESGEAESINLNFTVNIPNTVQGVFDAAQNGGFSAILQPFYLRGSLYIFGNGLFDSLELEVDTIIPWV